MTKSNDELLACPFCEGEAEFQLNGTQPDVSCKDCGISYSIQASDHFTREERFDDPGFAFIMEPHYCYAEKGIQRIKDVLTEYWNTRANVTPTDGDAERAKVDSTAQEAIDDLRYFLGEETADDYYSDVREPIEKLIAEVQSYHRALKAALQSTRKPDAVTVSREVLQGVREAIRIAVDLLTNGNGKLLANGPTQTGLEQALASLDAVLSEGK